jgi:thiol-disulfide isomerase/thioredoxin
MADTKPGPHRSWLIIALVFLRDAPRRQFSRVMDRSWLIIALVFLGFWVVYLTFFAPGNRRPLEGSGIDLPADYNWKLEDLDEQPVQFSRFKGKTVFLNIWATWCGPCVGEMPSIARLAENLRLKGKNIEFVCVSTDDSTDTVVRFVRDKHWPMTVLRAQSLPPVFLTEAIPATYIITPGGRVVAAEVGANDWDKAEVVAFLEKAAATKPGPADESTKSPAGPGG